jgi:hypothetical protein
MSMPIGLSRDCHAADFPPTNHYVMNLSRSPHGGTVTGQSHSHSTHHSRFGGSLKRPPNGTWGLFGRCESMKIGTDHGVDNDLTTTEKGTRP